MSKECKYVSRKEVKERRELIESVFPKVKEDVIKEFKFGFSSQVVGSAKRNLVVKNGESLWDIDYQFIFNSKNFNEKKFINLKKFISDSLKRCLSKEFNVNLSTSVITISKLNQKGSHAEISFDIALIMYNDKTYEKKILRGNSEDNTNEKNKIRWEELRGSEGYYEKRKLIKGQNKWEKMRKIFLTKKCKNDKLEKDNQNSGFSIYIESIKETLDSFEK